MEPENYVEPPNLGKLVTTGPNEAHFWQEVDRTFDWVRYMWVGPTPNVTIDLKNVYPGRQFSPQSVYAGILEAIAGLRIPGVVASPQIIHEGGPFSPYRAYLRIRRELSEFLVCAAPVGNSFFITVRKIDRFVHVKWFHYLFVLAFLAGVVFGSFVVFGNPGGFVFSMILFSLAWSLMRYAAHMTMSWLGEHLPSVPVIGALYLRWFRPDTYFRQDLHSAFLALVDSAIKSVLAGMDPTQPIRPATENQGAPILNLRS